MVTCGLVWEGGGGLACWADHGHLGFKEAMMADFILYFGSYHSYFQKLSVIRNGYAVPVSNNNPACPPPLGSWEPLFSICSCGLADSSYLTSSITLHLSFSLAIFAEDSSFKVYPGCSVYQNCLSLCVRQSILSTCHILIII